MYSRKFYFLILLSFVWTFQSLDAQNLTLFSQAQEAEGTAISGSSSSRSIHIADDFVLTSDVKLSKVTFFGAKIADNLSDILLSTDFFIVEADELTSAPGTEHVVYESVESMDGITVIPYGYDRDFEIDLSEQEVYLEGNKTYWVIFTANIDAPYPSNITDWHCYPGVNTTGTSLAQIYTNDAWSSAVSGLTFSIEGENTLGITEVFNSEATVLASTIVTHHLEVRADDFKSLSVYDLAGKMILSSDKTITDVAALTPGTYLSVVTTLGGQNITTKFIKK